MYTATIDRILLIQNDYFSARGRRVNIATVHLSGAGDRAPARRLVATS